MKSNNSVVYRLWYWCQNTILKMIYLYKKKILEQINLIRKETTKTSLFFRRFESVLISGSLTKLYTNILLHVLYINSKIKMSNLSAKREQ